MTTRQNYHRSKLPKLGDIVRTPDTKRKAIVVAFPLCDNVLPWSIGIHTCYLQTLDNGEMLRYSGFYFVDRE